MRPSAFLVALLVPLASNADVPLPGTQPEQFQGSDPDYAPLSPSRACRTCHADYADEDYEPYDGWSGSMMGNAARDPVFLAALSIAEADLPGSGDFCLRCHAPEAWLEGRSTPGDGSILEAADDGVTCHFCHRLIDADPVGLDPAAPYVGNARFFITLDSDMRGPYEGDLPTSPHGDTLSGYHGEARLCGLCHDISNPLVPWRAEDGSELSPEFPIERTYSEWLRSAFPAEGTTCQDCHMPAFEGTACNVSDAPVRPDVYAHEWAGGNAWVPLAFTHLYPELERDEAWATTREAAIRMLQDAATVAFEAIPDTVDPGGALALSVRVTNRTGHKLPTGYPEGRRMWLEVLVTDAGGATLLESGTYDETSADRLEDEQLRTYEVELGVAGEGRGFHFILNDVIYSDTRIPPRGYAPQEGDSGLLPVGRDYGDGAGGYLDHDIAPYGAEVPCGASGPLFVRVRLRQQTSSREYIEFLRDSQSGELGTARGATLAEAWEATGQSSPVVMAEIVQEVGVSEAPASCVPDAGPEPDSGVDAGTGGGGGGDGGCCSVAGRGFDREWITTAAFGVMLWVCRARARGRRRRDG